jgi:hypothetical protein
MVILQIVSTWGSLLKLKSISKRRPFPVQVEAGKKYITVSPFKLYCRIWGCVTQDSIRNEAAENNSFFMRCFLEKGRCHTNITLDSGPPPYRTLFKNRIDS